MEVTQSAAAKLRDRDGRPAWDVSWLTPIRCRILFAALLVFGFVSHIQYLHGDRVPDLSGDEAHYWDWSRQLDLSYYSKGPLVAYIIRASCAIFGDTMFGVRFPALVLTIGTSLLTYWLARRLFASDRIALGTVLLTHLVPMFVAGSILMTIDPPFYFCWAAATCLAVKAVWDERRWAWIALGVVIGVGFLAKYAMFLWLVGFGMFLLDERRENRRWQNAKCEMQMGRLGFWVWVMIGVALVFTTPVIVWNMRHGWLSLRHVAHQTGAQGGRWSIANPIEFFAAQIFVIGPPLFVMMVEATRYGLRGGAIERRRETRFLALIGATFFAIVFASSLLTKVQVNWPAPAYFTLMILTAYWLSTRLRARRKWKPWRGWFYGTVIFGLLMMPIAHDMTLAYPIVPRINAVIAWTRDKAAGHPGSHFLAWVERRTRGRDIAVRNIDPTAKLRGWHELGTHVGQELHALRPGAFILCEDYQETAEMAFYVPGQPRTYCAGTYATKPSERKRFSQYDVWPDRALDRPELLGRDAIYVGYMPRDVRRAFGSVEPTPLLDITRDGLKIRSFRTWRCIGFKGMHRPKTGATY